MRTPHYLTVIASGVLVGALGGCGAERNDWVVTSVAGTPTGEQIRIVGTVRHYDLEGRFYAIRGDDSVTYDPRNLPESFQREGLKVEAEARRRTDMASIHQVGQIVDLERIRLR